MQEATESIDSAPGRPAGPSIWAILRRRWWLIVALSAWVLSLGSLLKLDDAPLTVQVGGYATAIPLPAALLPYIPVLNIARTPGRFNFAVGFAAAILAGYGAATGATTL